MPQDNKNDNSAVAALKAFSGRIQEFTSDQTLEEEYQLLKQEYDLTEQKMKEMIVALVAASILIAGTLCDHSKKMGGDTQHLSRFGVFKASENSQKENILTEERDNNENAGMDLGLD